MSVVNLPQNIPAKAWIITALAIFILALCIGISFIKGLSTINHKIDKEEDNIKTELIKESKK